MSKWILTIAALILIGCGNLPQSGRHGNDPLGSELRIAAWNIEHLAAEPGFGCEPRDLEDYRRVADIIHEVDADIWLLQEIESAGALAHVFDPEEWIFHVERRPSTGPGPLCRGREDGNRLRMQRTAIVVRNGIDHVRGVDLAALDVDQRGRLRHGVTVSVRRGEATLDIMSVHLKSGCFFGEEAEACPTLLAQVPILEAWIDEQGSAGRAVIVGGDFNRRLAVPGDAIWQDLNDGDPVQLENAGESARTQCDARYSEFIDFFVLNEYAEEQLVRNSFAEVTLEERNRPSDHCPISFAIR